MFIGRINDAPVFSQLPDPLAEALVETLSNGLGGLEVGRYDLESVEGAYYMVMAGETKLAEECQPEAHRAFIDLQLLVDGRERLGMALPQELEPVVDELDEKDYALYPVPAGEIFVDAEPGDFFVFFPGEIHRPMMAVEGPEPVRKVVIKVPFEAL